MSSTLRLYIIRIWLPPTLHLLKTTLLIGYSRLQSIDDEVLMLESSLAASEQQLKRKRVPGASFLEISFETINVLTRSHTASYTSADDNQDKAFDVNDWMTEANEPQALDDRLFFYPNFKYGYSKIMIASVNPSWLLKSVILDSGFYEGDYRLLRRRH